MPDYAEVAVNVPVERTFHYHIPPELAGRVLPGHLVRVSFGTAMQPGIVVDLPETSDIPQTKPIVELLDPDPVVNAEQIALARWMQRRYLAPPGPCLWLMLTPGMTGSPDKRITLIDDEANATDDLQSQIIALLKKRGPLRGEQIQRSMKAKQWRAAVSALKTAEAVRVESVLTRPRVKAKQINTAALAIHPDRIHDMRRHLGKRSREADLLARIADDEGVMPVAAAKSLPNIGAGTIRNLLDTGYVFEDDDALVLDIPQDDVDDALFDLRQGETDFRVLRVLARQEEPIDVSWVYTQTGADVKTLKRLAAMDLIALGEQRTWRDSLADRDFVPVSAPLLTPAQAAAWWVIRDALQDPTPTLPGGGESVKQDPLPTSPVDGESVKQDPLPTSPVDGGGAKTVERIEHDDVSGTLKRSERWKVPPELWGKIRLLASEKRAEPTDAENQLWQHIRRKQLDGYKFRRQHGIDRFIVDFYCREANLVIEVDGLIHDQQIEEDQLRQQFLEALGLHVLRFTNEQVFKTIDAVIQSIRDFLSSQVTIDDQGPSTAILTPSPSTGRAGEGSNGGRGSNSSIFLLHGVTGSGKTEMYLRAIAYAIGQGRQALFLVPEIALTAQTVRRVAARFPGRVGVLHSGLSDGERYDTWTRARSGDIDVIVGTRSAIFAPLPDIGVIVLDEAHDSSYKQSPPLEPPHYHARDVAERLAREHGAVLVLGTATPDVETYYRAQRGEIALLHLPQRIVGHRQRVEEQAARVHAESAYSPGETEQSVYADLPPVDVIDMREELKAGNIAMFSRALQHALGETLARGEQAILFLNRRGQSTYVFCRDCGHVETCPRCDTPLTFHREGMDLQCHHCGFHARPPAQCPNCKSRRIKYFGAGTQQVQSAVTAQFPSAVALRWDADTITNAGHHEMILQRFANREANVLIGTQMVAKGLDLPYVTLVGVVSADVGLALPDFRAGERVFQLLTQVAGRAGRGVLGGRVILQTYQPEHYAIITASTHDFAGFYKREIAYRRDMGYPPFRRLIRLEFRSTSPESAGREAERAAAMLRAKIGERGLSGTEMIGPAPGFFGRINRQYRWHLLLRGPDPAVLLDDVPIGRGWSVDVDPLDIL